MKKRITPKPAKPTKGDEIVDWYCESHAEGNTFNESPTGRSLALRINRAIAAAVRAERERCEEPIIGRKNAIKIRSGT